ncbi:MAG: ribonuclease PH [Pseudobdellovibrionaceae bacterium]
MRIDGRKNNQLRPIRITPHVSEFAEGSAIVEFGKTKVLCTASLEDMTPKWLQGTGQGWVTAEYGMLPRSTQQRIRRDKSMTGGRTQEISRLIGRSLRAAVDLKLMSEKSIIVDCDVLHADGGTRTASVTGGFVALAIAIKKLMDVGEIKTMPLQHYVSAISVGLKEPAILLDLNYEEDSSIGTDMNFVMTSDSRFVEIQGTAESTPFSREHLLSMMDVATEGCKNLFAEQQKIVGEFYKPC